MPTYGEINGHAGKAGLHRIEVYRVETTEPVFVRLLSPDYKGLFTHYVKGRSQYCIGEGCRLPNHGQERTWKGYCAAERLMVFTEKGQRRAVMIPCCLEITEYLELDMRGVFARGQLWELWKLERDNGKKAPVTGKPHADEPPADLRKPFDIMPCLRAVYHRDVIDLKHPSPLPPRVYVEETPTELPAVLQPKAAEEMWTGGFDLEGFRKQQAAAGAAKKSPSEAAREKPYAR